MSYLCQSVSQIQRNSYRKASKIFFTDTLYESAHINHSVVTAATHIQIRRRMITATCIQIRVAAVLWRICIWCPIRTIGEQAPQLYFIIIKLMPECSTR